MATKLNPGQFDCYAKAAPDEPLFVLRSTDHRAPHLVRIWAMVRAGHFTAAHNEFTAMIAEQPRYEYKADEKMAEAMKCAAQMENWKRSHP